ncbi:hypothetical protein H6F86_20745 [Phormidium sp. FACHB-592]|uniref:Uncharacterized protein n=1 Tax=Stenomitos frigidus AS-A4 TaxID=2933935 RepID=A0ABV0KEJ4_9CYAN|nr:hypothetical protein [Phormidium sp. FACHB-592]MBD2076262.1 hypothetical protein [Phormidium sp. FACHB-592]
MPSLYGTCRSIPTGITIAPASGGSLSTSSTLYLSTQYRTRGGLSLHSAITPIAYSAGQKIVVTVTPSALASGELGSVHEIVVSGSTTNDVAQMVRLGAIPLLAIDQTTQLSLPRSLELSTNAHIALSASVATIAALPTGSDRLNGMVRLVTATGQYLRYDSTATTGVVLSAPGYWVDYYPWVGAANGFTTYIGTATNVDGGIDNAITEINPADVLRSLPYAADGGNSTPLRLCYLNELVEDGGNAIEALAPIAVSMLLDNVDQSTAFSNKIYARYLGKFRKLDGTLDTTFAASAIPVLIFDTKDGRTESNLFFPEFLDRGYGALYEFYLNFRSDEIAALRDGSTPSLSFGPAGEVGTYNPLGFITGNGVFGAESRLSAVGVNDEYLRVIPGSNSVVSLPGAASISSYIFFRAANRSATGLAPNTAGQKVVISGTSRGQIVVQPPGYMLESIEAIRAIVSTASGTATPGAFFAPVSVGASGTLSVSITIPALIRANYPDVIAGLAAGYNVPNLKVYLRFSGTITAQTALVTVGAGLTTLNFVITTNAGTVGALPTNPDTTFSLFANPTIATVTAGTGGNLAAGSYEVAIANHYPAGNTQLSAISHDPALGCLKEVTTDLADAIAGAKGYTLTTASYVQPPVGALVVVSVPNTAIFGILQPLFVQGGGGYLLTGKTANTLTLERSTDNGSDYAATGQTIASNALVVPGGMPGTVGASGEVAGLRYTFSSITAPTPASQSLRLNSAAPSGATAIYVSEFDRAEYNVATVLNTLTPGSLLLLASSSDQSVYHYYSFVSQVDNGSDRTLNVTYAGGGGAFIDLSDVSLSLLLKGTPGAPGTTGTNGLDGISGFGVRYSFSTSTAPTPTVGQLRLNNVAYNSATLLYVSESDRFNITASLTLNNISDGSTLLIFDEADPTAYVYALLTSQTDNGSDRTFAITNVTSSGTLSGNVTLSFAPKGAPGAPGTVNDTVNLGLSSVGTDPITAADIIRLYNKLGQLVWRQASNGSVLFAAATNLEQSWAKAQKATVTTLIDNTTISLDASLSNLYQVTLAGNRTLANPTNLAIGTNFEVKLIQDSTGTRSLSYGTAYKFSSGTAPPLSIAGSAVDLLSCRSYDGTTLQCDLGKGYA